MPGNESNHESNVNQTTVQPSENIHFYVGPEIRELRREWLETWHKYNKGYLNQPPPANDSAWFENESITNKRSPRSEDRKIRYMKIVRKEKLPPVRNLCPSRRTVRNRIFIEAVSRNFSRIEPSSHGSKHIKSTELNEETKYIIGDFNKDPLYDGMKPPKYRRNKESSRSSQLGDNAALKPNTPPLVYLYDHKDGRPIQYVDNRLCKVCGAHLTAPNVGLTCLQCTNFTICPLCEAAGFHPMHYMLRVPAGTAEREAQAVLSVARRAVLAQTQYKGAQSNQTKTPYRPMRPVDRLKRSFRAVNEDHITKLETMYKERVETTSKTKFKSRTSVRLDTASGQILTFGKKKLRKMPKFKTVKKNSATSLRAKTYNATIQRKRTVVEQTVSVPADRLDRLSFFCDENSKSIFDTCNKRSKLMRRTQHRSQSHGGDDAILKQNFQNTKEIWTAVLAPSNAMNNQRPNACDRERQNVYDMKNQNSNDIKPKPRQMQSDANDTILHKNNSVTKRHSHPNTAASETEKSAFKDSLSCEQCEKVFTIAIETTRKKTTSSSNTDKFSKVTEYLESNSKVESKTNMSRTENDDRIPTTKSTQVRPRYRPANITYTDKETCTKPVYSALKYEGIIDELPKLNIRPTNCDKRKQLPMSAREPGPKTKTVLYSARDKPSTSTSLSRSTNKKCEGDPPTSSFVKGVKGIDNIIMNLKKVVTSPRMTTLYSKLH